VKMKKLLKGQELLTEKTKVENKYQEAVHLERL